MFTEFSTYILYNLILLLCPLLCYIGQKDCRKGFVKFAYLILILISIFRFDIGADYENYAYGIIKRVEDINKGYPLKEILILYAKEPTMIILNYMFSWSQYSFVWVIGIYSIVSHFLLYKTLEYYKVHTWGLFIYILSFMLFQGWDWVRQSVAMSVFLYGIRYLETNNLKRFMLCGFVAFLFHYSAIIVLTICVLRFVNINTRRFYVILLIVLIMAEFGLFNFVNKFLSTVMIYYSDDYLDSKHVLQISNTYHSTTYILTMFWYIFILFVTRNSENKILVSSFFIGAVLYGIGGGNLIFLRMSYYLAASQIIIFPWALKRYKNKILLTLMIAIQFAVFNKVYIGSNFRGCTPYETIFSEKFEKQDFRIRNY